MSRTTLPIALAALLCAAGPAWAQRDSGTPTRTLSRTSAEPSVEDLQRELEKLASRVDGLAADLQAARDDAETARSEAAEARSEADALAQRLDDLTSGITISGDVLTVRRLNAQIVVTEEIDAETYQPGAGNVW